MKTKELADWLGVSPNTVRYWTLGDFKEYLSPTAQGGSGRVRNFTDTDARIIAFIATMRQEGAETAEIHMALSRLQTEEWADLPPMPAAPPGTGTISMISREVAETAISTQRTALMREIVLLQERVENLETQLMDEREKRDAAQSELTTARENLGRLEGKLEVLEHERGNERQLLLRGLIAVAVIATTLLAVVVLLALVNVGGA